MLFGNFLQLFLFCLRTGAHKKAFKGSSKEKKTNPRAKKQPFLLFPRCRTPELSLQAPQPHSLTVVGCHTMAKPWMCSAPPGKHWEKRSQGHLLLTFRSIWRFKVKGGAELELLVVRGLSQGRGANGLVCFLCCTSLWELSRDWQQQPGVQDWEGKIIPFCTVLHGFNPEGSSTEELIPRVTNKCLTRGLLPWFSVL